MAKRIQIRNVPDDVHSTMLAERPTMREWLDLTRQLKPLRGKVDSARLIRELRESR